MAKVEGDQNIPVDLMFEYEGQLRPKTIGRPWDFRRNPFNAPRMRKAAAGVSAAQRAQRAIFEKSVRCYNCQPYTGGITPPGNGPRNRSWWYDEALGSGLWYYDYFMQQTMNGLIAGDRIFWCREALLCMQTVDESNPNSSFWGFYEQQARWGSNGKQSLIYFKRQGMHFEHLEVLEAVATWWRPGSAPSLVLRFHEIEDDFNCVALTWNNRPAVGPAVGSYVMTYNNWWKLVRIPIPVKTERFAISIDPDPYFRALYLRGRDPVLENGWAYMVP